MRIGRVLLHLSICHHHGCLVATRHLTCSDVLRVLSIQYQLVSIHLWLWYSIFVRALLFLRLEKVSDIVYRLETVEGEHVVREITILARQIYLLLIDFLDHDSVRHLFWDVVDWQILLLNIPMQYFYGEHNLISSGVVRA